MVPHDGRSSCLNTALSPAEINDLDDDNVGSKDEDEACYPEDAMAPALKLQHYAKSDNIFSRQMVARNVLDTLRIVQSDPEEVTTVLEVVATLSDDPEPSVRAELMEQVPHVAVFCQEKLPDLVTQHLVPAVVRFLTDENNQVRKTSQAAVLVLLEQGLLAKDDVEKQIFPIILRLADELNADHFRTEAVVLMSKMAPLLGSEDAERLFIFRFCKLCGDSQFHVRKVCAANFGDMCSVLGTKATENCLLSRFFRLCKDSFWGVRKACADVFVAVSCVCSPDVRSTQLSTVFTGLLADQSKWVKMAAFEALGPFISTFADPSKTGLYYAEDGLHWCEPSSLIGITDDQAHLPENSSENILLEENVVKSISEKEELRKDETDSTSAVLEKDQLVESFDISKDVLNSTVLDTNDDSGVGSDDGSGNSSVCSPDIPSPDILSPKRENENFAWGMEGGIDQDHDSTINFLDSSDATITSDNLNELSYVDVSSISVSSACDSNMKIPSNIENEFNNFNYWRIPIQDLDLNINSDPGNTSESIFKYSDCKNYPVHTKELNARIVRQPNIGFNMSETSQTEESVLVKPSDFLCSLDGNCQDNYLPEVQTASSTKIESSRSANIAEEFNFIETSDMWHYAQSFDQPDWWIQPDMAFNNYYPKRPVNSSIPEDTPPSTFTKLQREQLEQKIVPVALLEEYVGMVDPIKIENVDCEITRHCAYSIPGVALTLGRRHWNILKSLYVTLSSDMQWKVRRTLAFSIHELAAILGSEIAATDLVPVFNSFIKDVDEVRVGILRNLANFLKLLPSAERQSILPKIEDFMKVDNPRNWRYRWELSEQVGQLAALFSPEDVRDYLVSIINKLIQDKVAAVRLSSQKVMAVLLGELTTGDLISDLDDILTKLVEQYATSPKWSGRQTFVLLCVQLLEDAAVPSHLFATSLLPSLMGLAGDNVACVRMAVARALYRTVKTISYFTSPDNPYRDDFQDTIALLQSDPDRDVRYFSSDQSYANSSTVSTVTCISSLPV